MISIVNADLNQAHHAKAVVSLLNDYASDAMGGSTPLSQFVQENLIAEFKKRSTIRVVLAFDGDVPVGLVNCIEGFSTFACKPLLNIHDLAVVKSHRGQGIGRKLLEYVAEMAKGMGCCKVTLEVLEINVGAYALYKSCGFAHPEKGNTMYMQKKIT